MMQFDSTDSLYAWIIAQVIKERLYITAEATYFFSLVSAFQKLFNKP